MIRNYLKIALRNIKKHKGYSAINIIGLAVGTACCWLLLLFVQDELRFDRFHKKADQIYRATIHGRMAGNEVTAATSPVPMAATLLAEFPEIMTATRIKPAFGAVLVSYDDRKFNEQQVYYADSTFFDVFTFPLIAGDATTALREPFSVVITEDMARKYFGQENPLEKTLTFNNRQIYKITGVAQNVPQQSHFHFDFLASFNSWDISRSTAWTSNHLYTYFVLQENYPPERLAEKLPALVRKYAGPQMEAGLGVTYTQFIASGGVYEYALQPLNEIHLHSHLTSELEPNGDMNYIAIFSLIAFFILLLACINFMNLATARSANRAKEIGLRKVVGSSRLQLVRQFLLESFIVTSIALLAAIGLVELFLPVFNNLTGKLFSSAFVGGWTIAPILFVVTIFVGLLAGSYPAFFLAAFRPIAVLKNRQNPGGKSHAFLRKILVVSQFAISIVLMIGTFVVFSQLQYIRTKQLGFDKEHVLLIHNAETLGQQIQAYENELKQHPTIRSVAASSHLPGREVKQNVYQIEGDVNKEGYILANLDVGFDFIETLGIELVTGRSFSRDFSTDSTAFIINEAAAQKLGWQDPLGKILINAGAFKGPVIGIVKNFHFASLHEEIQPVVLNLSHEDLRFVTVRIAPDQTEAAINFLREKWQQSASEQPFEYSFLDEDFGKLYRTDQRTSKISATFSAISIFIACLGLFGLAAFSSEQRTKEIGVRKVLGAPIVGIIVLLSKEFTQLVVIAFLIAVAPAYFFMNKWLENFAYRIDIGWWIFAFAGGLALLTTLLTVSTQAVRAALVNPVEALRYE